MFLRVFLFGFLVLLWFECFLHYTQYLLSEIWDQSRSLFGCCVSNIRNNVIMNVLLCIPSIIKVMLLQRMLTLKLFFYKLLVDWVKRDMAHTKETKIF